jgi:hypothetical protein
MLTSRQARDREAIDVSNPDCRRRIAGPDRASAGRIMIAPKRSARPSNTKALSRTRSFNRKLQTRHSVSGRAGCRQSGAQSDPRHSLKRVRPR